MILKYMSHAFWADDPDCAQSDSNGRSIVEIIPAQGWTWLDDVDKVKITDRVVLPVDGTHNVGDPDPWDLYSMDHFADCHWVGINPSLFNKYSTAKESRTPEYQMCYIYRKNGKVDLLAIGFLAEVYLLNDDGKTIDKIENPNW